MVLRPELLVAAQTLIGDFPELTPGFGEVSGPRHQDQLLAVGREGLHRHLERLPPVPDLGSGIAMAATASGRKQP